MFKHSVVIDGISYAKGSPEAKRAQRVKEWEDEQIDPYFLPSTTLWSILLVGLLTFLPASFV